MTTQIQIVIQTQIATTQTPIAIPTQTATQIPIVIQIQTVTQD